MIAEIFWIALSIAAIAILILVAYNKAGQRKGALSPTARDGGEDLRPFGAGSSDERSRTWGAISPMLICPHCQTKGLVRRRQITRKVGVSGAKATAAVLTLGTSLFVAGLSRKAAMTRAHCDACGSS